MPPHNVHNEFLMLVLLSLKIGIKVLYIYIDKFNVRVVLY